MAKADAKTEARARREQAQAAAQAAARRTRNLQLLGGTVAAAVVVVLLVVILSGGKETPKQGVGADTSAALEGVAATRSLLDGVEQHGLTLGDPKAPITMLEFLDVQCPFCRDHQLDQQPTVIKDLVRTGKIQLRMQPVALPQMGEDSEAGRAVVLRESHVDKAWDFVNLFYLNQGDEGTGYVTAAYLQRLLGAIPGATKDVTRTIDARDEKLASEIDEHAKAIAEKYAADGKNFGTPAFAIARTGAKIDDYEPVYIESDDGAGTLAAAVARLAARNR
ncbi:MAG: thioredoxin domain-containing protein [Patulibacter minatonensis]